MSNDDLDQGARMLLEQMERELFKDSGHDLPRDPLFHYTNSTGLLGILKSKRIRATHYKHLNDRQELQTAERLITEEARRLAQKWDKQSNQCLFLQDFADVHHSNALTKKADVYLAALSEDGDLLSQWRAYGDDGKGYALGFNKFFLPKGGANDYVPGAPFSLILYKCEYDEGNFRRTARETLKQMAHGFDRYWTTYCEHESRNDLRQAVFGRAVTIGLRRVAAMVPRFKHRAFSEEREWRLVLLPEPSDPAGAVEFRSGPRGVTPYLAAPLVEDDEEPLGIAEVRIGPRHDPDVAEKSAELLLSSLGYDKSLVQRSNVPYRGEGL